MKYRVTIALVLIAAGTLSRGRSEIADRSEIAQTLRDLSQPCVLMDISAHPDDEDGATLAYYRMKYGVHTYSVLFTRGEGGQNEKGSELYEDLGVIRTAETRAAGAILGAEVEFLNFPDFGYSKSATEAFRIWGGQREVLRRLVYVIRRVKPDVLFSNHSTWGGHGQHQAAAVTAIAAFDAAADSSMFSEQLDEPGIALWQPRKMFLRVFGGSAGTPDAVHNLEEVNDIRGVAYVDIATEALRMHRTQGLDRADLRAFNRGRSSYRLARANSLFSQDSTDFFSGIRNWSHEPLKSLMPLADLLQTMQPEQPWETLTRKVSSYLHQIDAIGQTPAGRTPLSRRILARWRERVEHLAAVAGGVGCRLRYDDSVLVAGQRMQVIVSPHSAEGPFSVDSIGWSLPNGWSVQQEEFAAGANMRKFTLRVSDRPMISFPKAEHLYRPIEDGNTAEALLAYTLNGKPLTLRVPLVVDVALPHLLRTGSEALWVRPGDAARGVSFACTVENMFPHKSAGAVSVGVPVGWKARGFTFALEKEGAAEDGSIHLVGPANPAEGEYTIHLSTDHATRTIALRVADVVVPAAVRVGLVSSYDSTLSGALRDLRVRCDTLNDVTLAKGDFSPYHTIIIDMRAYLVRIALREQNRRLIDWVRGGGNLVVMYQRDAEWKREYAPFPFSISRQRVTMEDAPVTALLPQHALLRWPNAITSRDWDGWKQERSVYLPVEVHPAYERLISTHDPNEPEADTGYLCASYGTGSYIYTTYVWYRQLKDRHPGALRCLANMVSYPLRAR